MDGDALGVIGEVLFPIFTRGEFLGLGLCSGIPFRMRGALVRILSMFVWGEMGETRLLPGPLRGEEGEMGDVTLAGVASSVGKANLFFFRSPPEGCSKLGRLGATCMEDTGATVDVGVVHLTGIFGELSGGGPFNNMCCILGP